MNSSSPPNINPFQIPGEHYYSAAEPLCPWKHEEHLPYYLDIDSARTAFDTFVDCFTKDPPTGSMVLATGDSGCGKTALVNRCAHWLRDRERPRHLIVDLRRTGLAEMPRSMTDRLAGVCQELVEHVRPMFDPATVNALEGRLSQPDQLFPALGAALARTDSWISLLLPTVEDLIEEVRRYAEFASVAAPRMTIFAESAFIDPNQVRDGLPNSVILLNVGTLRSGDVNLFVRDRLSRHAHLGAFPRMDLDTIAEISPALLTVAQLQTTLFQAYERRLVTGDRYTDAHRITMADIQAVAGSPSTNIAPSPTPDIDASAALTEPGPTIGTEVGWSKDTPADIDLLQRDALAAVLADRIRETSEQEPGTSLLVHLDGQWGSGKSTLLRFLGKRLAPHYLIVRFDAWQQSRLSPPWWALLTALRAAVAADRGWWARRWLNLREMAARVRRSGAPYLLALLLLLVMSTGLGVAVAAALGTKQPRADAVANAVKVAGSVLVALGTLWSGARIASRVLLWDSAGGARLFERSDTNPMGRVAEHFCWLVRRSRRPVVFFIDDLDRCRNDYVVDLLDSVQTLIRDAPGRMGQGPHAAYFVVAADGSWLRQSYAAAYESFGDGAARRADPLGYDFMAKLFQLSVPMPAVSTTAQRRLLGHLLGLPAASAPDDKVAAAKLALDVAQGDEVAVLRAVESFAEPAVREAVAPLAARAVAVASRAYSEHVLRKFAPLLSPNPRQTKQFLNSYSMLRAVRTLEGNTVAPDVLALWCIVRVRWPSVADHLQSDPEAVRGLVDPLWRTEAFPEHLWVVAASEELRRVVCHSTGGPLTAASIRQCCGALGR